MASASLSIPVLLKTREDRRCADRFEAAMPMRVDGQPGTTRDLSIDGLSFRAKRPYALGAVLDVVVEYRLDSGTYPLQFQAEVVRSVPEGSGYIVGARLLPRSQATPASLVEERPQGRPELRSAH